MNNTFKQTRQYYKNDLSFTLSFDTEDSCPLCHQDENSYDHTHDPKLCQDTFLFLEATILYEGASKDQIKESIISESERLDNVRFEYGYEKIRSMLN